MPRRFLWTTKELCTDCDGTGEEYIITPEQWEEYQVLLKSEVGFAEILNTDMGVERHEPH